MYQVSQVTAPTTLFVFLGGGSIAKNLDLYFYFATAEIANNG